MSENTEEMWINFEPVAKWGIQRVMKVLKMISIEPDEDFLIEVQKKAKKGLLPNPNLLEKDSKDWKKILAALIHFEIFMFFRDSINVALEKHDEPIDKQHIIALVQQSVVGWAKVISIIVNNQFDSQYPYLGTYFLLSAEKLVSLIKLLRESDEITEFKSEVIQKTILTLFSALYSMIDSIELLTSVINMLGYVFFSNNLFLEQLQLFNAMEYIMRREYKFPNLQSEAPHSEFIMLLINKAVVLSSLQRYNDALDVYNEIEKISTELIKKGRTELQETLGEILIRKGSIFNILGNFESAIQSFDAAEKIFNVLVTESNKRNHYDYLIKLFKYKGSTFFELKKFENALEEYTKAEELVERILKTENGLDTKKKHLQKELIKILIRKGDALVYLNQLTGAYSIFLRAEEILKKLITKDEMLSADLGSLVTSLLGKMCQLLNQINKYSDAIVTCTNVERILKEHISEKSEDEKRDLAEILMNKGIAFDNLTQFYSAIEAYTEAETILVDLIRKKKEHNKDTEDLELQLAYVLFNKGYTLQITKRLEEAFAVYTKVERIAQKYIDKGDNEAKILLADTLIMEGIILDIYSSFDEAIKKYSTAEKICRSIITRHSDTSNLRPIDARAYELLGRILINKGFALTASGREEEALKAYIEVEKIRRAIIKQGRTDYRESLANVLINKGTLLSMGGNYTDALNTFVEAENILREIIKHENRPDLKVTLAQTLMGKSNVFFKSNRLKDAINTLMEAEKLLKQDTSLYAQIVHNVLVILLSSLVEEKNEILFDSLIQVDIFELVKKFERILLKSVAGSISSLVRNVKSIDDIYRIIPPVTEKKLLTIEKVLFLIERIKYLTVNKLRVREAREDESSKKIENVVINLKNVIDTKLKSESKSLNELPLELLSTYSNLDLLMEKLRMKNFQDITDNTELLSGENYVLISGFDTSLHVSFIVKSSGNYRLFSFEKKAALNVIYDIVSISAYISNLFNPIVLIKSLVRSIENKKTMSTYEERVINYLSRMVGSNVFQLIRRISKIHDYHLKARLIQSLVKVAYKNHKGLLKLFLNELKKSLEEFYNLEKGREFIDFIVSSSKGKTVVFSPFGGLYLFPLELLPLHDPLIYKRKTIRVFSLIRDKNQSSIKEKDDSEKASVNAFGLFDMGADLPMTKDDMDALIKFSKRAKFNVKVKCINEKDPIDRSQILSALASSDVFYYSGHGSLSKVRPDIDIPKTFLHLSNGTQIDYDDLFLVSGRKRKFGAFLNCCESALLMPRRATIDLFGILPAFISAGFRFVLAPVLPIYDTYANAFFKTYLEKLLEKKNIVDALYETRIAFKEDIEKQKILQSIINDNRETSAELYNQDKFVEDYLIWMVQLYGDPDTELPT